LDSETDYGIEDPAPESVGRNPKPATSRQAAKPAKMTQSSRTQLSPTSRSPPKKSAPQGLYRRSAAFIAVLHQLVLNMAHSMSKNPMFLARMILFIVGLILTFSRRDVRDRVRRITDAGWDKVRRTVGMGVKVSYI